MALLTLKDIGKIYVSDGSVAVGIRGVNLSFDKGEFVAVTGKSGSGKSTLLNVISGMDTYEEGEMTVEGETTSHYLQSDWEAYRQKYISFVFQDYNIIESFTVLQNVELALMHIEDKKERRKRAAELLERVGLADRMRQKGSKLSGGQKQRTVIARALAKDSPIILADEPTGNLDSATAKEIIALMREISKDKLLIVVTHNYEEVEAYATRHIRVFDGAVESDRRFGEIPSTESAGRENETIPVQTETAKESRAKTRREQKKKERKANIRNGLTLGAAIFRAKPKLSLFLCLLLAVGMLGVFAITAFFDASDLVKKNYLFHPIEGRIIFTKQTGETLSDAEVEAVRVKYGAQEALHYDQYLDGGAGANCYAVDAGGERYYWSVVPTYREDYGDNILGRYPKAADEVFLYLPVGAQPTFGKRQLNFDTVYINEQQMKLVGVKYFYDNTMDAKALYTEEGFRVATAINTLIYNTDLSVAVNVGEKPYSSCYKIIPVDHLEGDFCPVGGQFDRLTKADKNNLSLTLFAYYTVYRAAYYDAAVTYSFLKEYTAEAFTDRVPDLGGRKIEEESLLVKTSTLTKLGEELLSQSYRRASLFFDSNRQAAEAAERMRDDGYIAVLSDTTYEPDPLDTILSTVLAVMMLVLWILCVLFFAFFLNLCSGRAVGAFRNDVAVMRSMGIPTAVVKIGMYVRMYLALIPALILLAVTANVIFRVPQLNGYFIYLQPWMYALIVLGMAAMTAYVTRKQIRKLFGTSVKKALKGGNAE